MLLNKPRAYEVMDKHGLDGLVACERLNVYYLTDFWGALMRMERPLMTMGLVPRKEDAPSALVFTAGEMLRLTVMPTWVENIIPCSYRSTGDQRDFDPEVEEPEAGDWRGWPRRDG